MRERNAYVIRNGRFDPDGATTERSFLTIAQRTIRTMLHYSGVNDAIRIYATTQRDGAQFRLAHIGPDFQFKPQKRFNQAYMRALFDYAYQKALNELPDGDVDCGCVRWAHRSRDPLEPIYCSPKASTRQDPGSGSATE